MLVSLAKVSPSQVNTFDQCQRLYAFTYVEGLRTPSTDKQQFGTDVHQILEDWMTDATPPPDTPEGAVAKQLLDQGWLPPPGPETFKEYNMRFRLLPGVIANGFIDLLIPPPAGDLGTVTDYKTTSSLRYAKTEEELGSDPQALMYSAFGMFLWSVPKVRVQWLYSSASNPKPKKMPNGGWIQPPRKPNGKRRVSRVFEASDPQYREQWVRLLWKIKALREIRDNQTKGMDLPPSPESCGAYGECPHKERCNLTGGDALAGFMKF